MRIGMAADHGGFVLKESLKERLLQDGHEVLDMGASVLDGTDDFPDYVVPLALAVAAGTVERGIAVCGSGVGASVCANKVPGVRAALITDVFSARQGVEDDHMNIACLGGRVLGVGLAWDLVRAYLSARPQEEARFLRRLGKISDLEHFSG